MRLSNLQKYILLYSLTSLRNNVQRGGLVKFYDQFKKKPKKDDMQNIITKSLERLIDKGLLIGHGVRTKHKWYIKEIRLTPIGKRSAKKLLGEQQKLPFKNNKKIKK